VLEGFLVGIIDASLLRKAMQSCSGVDTSLATLSFFMWNAIRNSSPGDLKPRAAGASRRANRRSQCPSGCQAYPT
jgi:hypothetical protein